MTAPDLAPFVLVEGETLPGLIECYEWKGWVIDIWTDGHCVLWNRTISPVLEFGKPSELVARALELEAKEGVA